MMTGCYNDGMVLVVKGQLCDPSNGSKEAPRKVRIERGKKRDSCGHTERQQNENGVIAN